MCLLTLLEKCQNTEFFSGPYFPVFGLNTRIYGSEKNSVFEHYLRSVTHLYLILKIKVILKNHQYKIKSFSINLSYNYIQLKILSLQSV